MVQKKAYYITGMNNERRKVVCFLKVSSNLMTLSLFKCKSLHIFWRIYARFDVEKYNVNKQRKKIEKLFYLNRFPGEKI